MDRSKNENPVKLPATGRISNAYRNILRAEGKNEISAGFQSPARDHMDHELCLEEYLITNPTATFYIRAEGNDQTSATIKDGDLLIVDRAKTPVNGNMVVAAMEDDLIIRQFIQRADGDVITPPDGMTGDPAVMALTDQDNLKIWGVINYVIHKV